MAWILLNKRITAIIILCLVVFGQLAYVNHLVGKLKKSYAKCETEKQTIINKYEKQRIEAQNEINRVSELYEIERSKEKVIYNEKEKELQTIIKTNTVYSDCKLDDRVREALRQATTTTKP